jgi:integrase
MSAPDSTPREGRFEVRDQTKNYHDRSVSLSVRMTDKLLEYLSDQDIDREGELLFPGERMVTDWEHSLPVSLDPIPDDLGLTRPNGQGRSYRHGTLTAYVAGGCTCDWCRRAYALYRRQRRAQGKDLHPTSPGRRPLLATRDAEHCDSAWFREVVWKQALAKAGIQRRVVPYDLRHTHATLLAHSGKVPPQILSDRMGHLDQRTTSLYLDQAPITLAKVAGDVIDEILTSPTTPRGRRGFA